MENIVYKAKGLKKSNFTLQCVLDIVLLIIGIAALFFSQMKHKTTSVSFYTSAGASLGCEKCYFCDRNNFDCSCCCIL